MRAAERTPLTMEAAGSYSRIRARHHRHVLKISELIELALGLAELLVGQAQPGDEGAQVQDSGLGDAFCHRDRGLTQDTERRLGIEPADAVLPEQPRQCGLAQPNPSYSPRGRRKR